MKCDTCGENIKMDCDWKQGRCPHVPPMLTNYHFRYFNLWQSIKNFFTKDDCNCGHKH
jgi:hypothetical protein